MPAAMGVPIKAAHSTIIDSKAVWKTQNPNDGEYDDMHIKEVLSKPVDVSQPETLASKPKPFQRMRV